MITDYIFYDPSVPVILIISGAVDHGYPFFDFFTCLHVPTFFHNPMDIHVYIINSMGVRFNFILDDFSLLLPPFTMMLLVWLGWLGWAE